MPAISTIAGFFFRMLLAAVLGALIGTERELTRHYAGIVTNIIVCVGAFAFTSFSFLAESGGIDVTRIASQVVSGIGFLGAGVILSDGTKVKGINTAATVWTSAAVGTLCALDKYWYAALITATIIVSHLIIHPVTEAIKKRREYDKSKAKQKREEAFYRVWVICSDESAAKIKTELISRITHMNDILLHRLEASEADSGSVKVSAEISLKNKNPILIESITAQATANKNVISSGWKRL